MKGVGKVELTSIRHIRGWEFVGERAGDYSTEAYRILTKHETVNCYKVRDAKGEYRFCNASLFDIMRDPKTKKWWAVFIDNILDEYTDVLRIEVAN